MLRKLFMVLTAGLALILAGCAEDADPEAGDQPGVEADEPGAEDDDPAGDIPADPENLDDCAEVSAAEGAPAGLTMMDSFFEPPCLAISSTQQIAITNSGNTLHNFSVADGDLDVDVEPGEEATTDETGTDLAAGTYRFFCKYHEAQGMVGTLVVE